MTQEQFVDLLSSWIRANKQAPASLQVSPDTELLGSGLLDSFDFLDLIVHIENATGCKIDLAVADPNEFSVVRGLWKLAVTNGTAASQPSGNGNIQPTKAEVPS
jgi:acyl carrier protein